MKHIDEYRDGDLARAIAATIANDALPDRHYKFMEFCGGHTHAISRYGIEDLLPSNVEMVHGPGCPVCVLPVGRIDDAIRLAMRPEVTLCTYADLMRVPASGRNSLLKAKAAGADIRMIYTSMDAVLIAEAEPVRQVVFFAIGFETTTPSTALSVALAQRKGLTNFSVFCNHVLTPPAIQAILDTANLPGIEQVRIDGFLGPAHVSTVIGTRPYDDLAATFKKPVVVAGFEPLDVVQAILMLVRQVNQGRSDVENQYIRAVTAGGNTVAQRAIAEIFELRDAFEWRGLGALPASALRLREAYAEFDAERRFTITPVPAADNPACECGDVLRGLKKPAECKLFGTLCSPETPMGSCMVSPEGACAAHWTYGRFRDRAKSGGVRVPAWTPPRLRARKLDKSGGRVDLSHGAGGRASAQLIDEIFREAFDNPFLDQGNDQAMFDVPAGRMVMSTDGYVIWPLFFPGGDIGSLAVHGTINDLAMAGARPLHLAASYILEEGFPLADLQRIAISMARAATAACVAIVTGDTKVVERGKGDGVFITTTGIGIVPPNVHLSGDRARPGDCVILSGSIGDHGVAVMSKRASLGFETNILSDSAALHGLVADMVAVAGPSLRLLRDPTRGGVAATLNEIAQQSKCGFLIQESAIPVREEVAAACELLGLDPLYVANEGKLIAVVAPDAAAALLAAMRAHPLGRDACLIGEVVTDDHYFVQMSTSFGGGRIVDWLAGEQLPRIC